jgi:hypothetical protein
MSLTIGLILFVVGIAATIIFFAFLSWIEKK